MMTDDKSLTPVYVAGTGVTRFGELWDEDVESLAIKAAQEALDEARSTLSEVDLLLVGNMLLGQLEQRVHVGAIVAQALGYKGPALTLEGACASGGLAVRQGVMAIRSGMAKKVLVVGVEKMTDVEPETITRALMAAGGEDEQWAGATFPALYALLHQAYQRKYKITDEAMARIAVLAHAYGELNPLAQFQKKIDVKQVLNSPLVADPIRLLHCAPISDGAAAIVLSSQLTVNSEQQIEIVGSGQGGDTLSLAQRTNLTSFLATKRAAAEAIGQAKINIKDIGVMEIHDCFSVAGYLAIEDLGVCEPGMATKKLNKHKLPVINPSGGLKAGGHPVGATGVKQVVEITRQLQKKGGKRQVKGVRFGLTQNVGGAGVTAVVHILATSH